VSIEATIQAQGFDYTKAGKGVVAGADSMLRLENDFSQMSYTVMDTDGNLLGPGGLASLVDESRLVDGSLYKRTGDGRWMRLDVAEPDTALGHVFQRLKETREFDDLGTVNRGGVNLRRFQPIPLVEYDPTYFDLDRDESTTFVALTDLYADEDGTPRLVEIEFGLKHAVYGTQVWTETYRIDAVGIPMKVDRPDAWVSARTLGFGFSGLDFLVPDVWQLAESDTQYTAFVTPEDFMFSIARGPAEGSDAAQLMRDYAAAQQAEILITGELESRMFPGVVASVRGPNGEVATFYTAVDGELGIAAGWFSPNEAPNEGIFEDVLKTLVYRPPLEEMVVPGETLGDRQLQTDVLNLILGSDPDCPETTVIFTKFVSRGDGRWSEDWYLHSCGILKVTRVDFTPEQDGIGFSFEFPFDPVGVSRESDVPKSDGG
jgi:hypothetical protein